MSVLFLALGHLEWVGRDRPSAGVPSREELSDLIESCPPEQLDERIESIMKGLQYVSRWDDAWAQVDDLTEGWYRFTEEFDFTHSAGAYNDWRRWLSRTMLGVEPSVIWEGPSRYRGEPFVELINFSDSEGTIGPNTAAKLMADFRAHRDRAVDEALHGAHTRRFYKDLVGIEADRSEILPIWRKRNAILQDPMDYYDEFSNAMEIASHAGAVLFLQ